MAVWVVRAGGSGEFEQYALDHDCVCIDWSDLETLADLSGRPALMPRLTETYDTVAEGTLRNWESQLWAFSNRIAVGDLVILPRKRTSTVAFGTVTGAYRYDTGAPPGSMHQVPVRWLRLDVPRGTLDSDLRYSIGGAMTVFQVSRNDAERRLRALLDQRPITYSTPQPAIMAIEAVEAVEATPNIAEIARDQISEHISQKFRGHELERLVDAILTAQGFVTDRTAPGADGGVDILCGRGALGLEAPRLCVQVKSASAAMDVKVIRELQGALASFGADLGLVVAWGGFTSAADKEARRNFFKIRLWGPDDLIEQLTSVYDRLPEDIRKDIPLRRVFALVTE